MSESYVNLSQKITDLNEKIAGLELEVKALRQALSLKELGVGHIEALGPPDDYDNEDD